MRGLSDRQIIVTGAASGIGRAVALRLAEEGAVVSLLDRDAAAAHAAAEQIASEGGRAQVLAVDITDLAQIQRSISPLDAIDGLVNCAGWDSMARFVDSEPSLWRRVVDINLFGTMNMLYAVLPAMVARRFGRIVNIASDAGRVGSSGEAVYSACKGGIIALGKTLAREHASDGIIVNTICPGPTDTPLLAAMASDGGLGERIVPKLARAVPMQRVGAPGDYPGAVAFLLSDDAAYMTGQTISISGGLTMHG